MNSYTAKIKLRNLRTALYGNVHRTGHSAQTFVSVFVLCAIKTSAADLQMRQLSSQVRKSRAKAVDCLPSARAEDVYFNSSSLKKLFSHVNRLFVVRGYIF